LLYRRQKTIYFFERYLSYLSICVWYNKMYNLCYACRAIRFHIINVVKMMHHLYLLFTVIFCNKLASRLLIWNVCSLWPWTIYNISVYVYMKSDYTARTDDTHTYYYAYLWEASLLFSIFFGGFLISTTFITSS